MKIFPSASFDAKRLATLKNKRIFQIKQFETAIFQSLVELVAEIGKAPLAFFSLLDGGQEHYLASRGIAFANLPRSQALGAYLSQESGILAVRDMAQDIRFEQHPWVVAAPHLRFYAGIPLISAEGLLVGSLAILDQRPRRLTAAQRKELEPVARQALECLGLWQEKRQAQRALQRYQSAVDTAGIGVWELGQDSDREMWLSPQFYRLLGEESRPEELDFESLLARLHPEDIPKLKNAHQQLAATDARVHCILRLAVRNQGYHWFAVRGQAVRDSFSREFKRMGVMVDIDKTQQVHLDFQRFHAFQERLYGLSYDLNLSQAEFLHSGLEVLCEYYGFSSSSVTRVQGGVYEILAVRKSMPLSGGQKVEAGQKYSLQGSLITQIFDQDQVMTLAQLSQVKGPHNAVASSYGLTALIGAPYWVNQRAHGVVTCYSYAPQTQPFTDLELEFMKVFCRWVGFMKERRFFIEKLKAISNNNARLLAVVAHDLRNVLSVIFSTHKRLEKNLLQTEPPDAKILTIMEGAIDNGMQLLDELLESAELEHTKQELPLEPLNLVAFVQGIVRQFEPQAEAKRIALQLLAEQGQVLVALYPRKMVRVLENLLSNALKFTPDKGQIQLVIRREDTSACLTVRDTGIGIPPHLLPVLFDKYSAARRQGLKGERSNGLGMFIVREIVESHGGTIEAASEVGRGTRFCITLPLVQRLTVSPRT